MYPHNSPAQWDYRSNQSNPPNTHRHPGLLPFHPATPNRASYPTLPFPSPGQGHPYPSPVPASLTPGRNRVNTTSISNADFFFQAPSPTRPNHSALGRHQSAQASFNYSQATPPVPPPPVPPLPYISRRDRAATSPPVPPKPMFTPPAVPPKVPLYPQGTFSSHKPVPSEAIDPEASEANDLALALALSAAESKEEQSRISAQEEEDIARAMEESVISEQSKSYFPYVPLEVLHDSSLHEASSSSGPSSQPHISPVLKTASLTNSPTELKEESWLSFTPDSASIQIEEDEALARQLAEEESQHSHSSLAEVEPEPPMYTPSETHGAYVPDNAPGPSMPVPRPTGRPPSLQNISSSASSISHDSDVLDKRTIPPRESTPPLSRPASADGPRMLISPKTSQNNLRASRPLSHVVSTPALPTLGEIEEDAGSRIRPPVNANQFVEPDLLHGFSVSFAPPVITTELAPMTGPLPNIISLPYGKCPPLHIQAPNWRQLLKLMARLSATRIEPTVEAMAAAKTELRLRTIIQFVKVHHSSQEWRTILWLTTDYPVPSNSLTGWKYTNNDPTTVPYSYTLSTIPALLRDGCDSPMAKYYTIPSTSSTPYPILPISFPNMAMYLQSALDDSRRLVHDSSSGIRKLAKMIELCYPSEHETSAVVGGEPERKSMGGRLFKKVMGRSIRQSRGKGGNEDTFELVTPFVADELEWG